MWRCDLFDQLRLKHRSGEQLWVFVRHFFNFEWRFSTDSIYQLPDHPNDDDGNDSDDNDDKDNNNDNDDDNDVDGNEEIPNSTKTKKCTKS